MEETSFPKQHSFLGFLPGQPRMVLLSVLLGMIAILLISAPSVLQAAHGRLKAAKVYTLDMTNCAGFTSADAAKILGLPASELVSRTNKLYATAWTCSFMTADGHGVSFSVSVAASAEKAAEDMEKMRNNLEIAGETAPFKGKLPKGAYSDIMGIGDEAVWTDVNGSLTVRKGNITVQVMSPAGKMEQLKVAEAFLAKF